MATVTLTNRLGTVISCPHPFDGFLRARESRTYPEISLRLLEESTELTRAINAGVVSISVQGSNSIPDSFEQASLDNLRNQPQTTGWPEITTTRTVTYTTVGGEHVFKIPLGNYFKDAYGETTLVIDGNQLYYPIDYHHVHRNFNNGGPASTYDTCIGFVLDGGPIGAGRSVIFTWIERRLLIEPPSIATVRAALSGGTWAPDYSLHWITSNPASTYNAVQVAVPPPGYVVEFWRLTPKRGGERLGPAPLHPNLKRDGQRYLPYLRGPATGTANEGLFLQSEFDPRTAGSTWKKFKVCYYRPSTGARGPLSVETIISAKPSPAPHDYDQHNGSGATRYHVWITR